MLFRQKFLDGIRDGSVASAYRRWRRPSVKAGGTLLTPVGQLRIKTVASVGVASITEQAARRAGYESRDALVVELNERREGQVYRITFGLLVADPRIALRKSKVLAGRELNELARRLRRLDDKNPWTARVLALLRKHPGVRAGDLCGKVGQDKESFKLNVRKLKNLGLTVSLGTGYRLSPRGLAFMRRGVR